jgi:hypothetical protein
MAEEIGLNVVLTWENAESVVLPLMVKYRLAFIDCGSGSCPTAAGHSGEVAGGISGGAGSGQIKQSVCIVII